MMLHRRQNVVRAMAVSPHSALDAVRTDRGLFCICVTPVPKVLLLAIAWKMTGLQPATALVASRMTPIR